MTLMLVCSHDTIKKNNFRTKEGVAKMRVITMNELMLKIKLSMHVKYYIDKRTYNLILTFSDYLYITFEK